MLESRSKAQKTRGLEPGFQWKFQRNTLA